MWQFFSNKNLFPNNSLSLIISRLIRNLTFSQLKILYIERVFLVYSYIFLCTTSSSFMASIIIWVCFVSSRMFYQIHHPHYYKYVYLLCFVSFCFCFHFLFFWWFFLCVIKVILNSWNSIFTFMIFLALVIIWVGFVCNRMFYQSHHPYYYKYVSLLCYLCVCVCVLLCFCLWVIKCNFKSMKSII